MREFDGVLMKDMTYPPVIAGTALIEAHLTYTRPTRVS